MRRADGYTDEQVLLHCCCAVSDGHPHEECRLHGRWPWSGDWLGAKRVVITENVPPGVVISTETEIFTSQASWDLIYRQMAIKVNAARDIRTIIEDRMWDVLAWLRRAGHDV